MDPATAALECRFLLEGVVVEDPRHQCGVNGWCGYGRSSSLSFADLIALGLFHFFFIHIWLDNMKNVFPLTLIFPGKFSFILSSTDAHTHIFPKQKSSHEAI